MNLHNYFFCRRQVEDSCHNIPLPSPETRDFYSEVIERGHLNVQQIAILNGWSLRSTRARRFSRYSAQLDCYELLVFTILVIKKGIVDVLQRASIPFNSASNKNNCPPCVRPKQFVLLYSRRGYPAPKWTPCLQNFRERSTRIRRILWKALHRIRNAFAPSAATSLSCSPTPRSIPTNAWISHCPL